MYSAVGALYVRTEPETSLSCDPSPSMNEEIGLQRTYMETMRDTVSQLNDILTSLVSRTSVTHSSLLLNTLTCTKKVQSKVK